VPVLCSREVSRPFPWLTSQPATKYRLRVRARRLALGCTGIPASKEKREINLRGLRGRELDPPQRAQRARVCKNDSVVLCGCQGAKSDVEVVVQI